MIMRSIVTLSQSTIQDERDLFLVNAKFQVGVIFQCFCYVLYIVLSFAIGIYV
jgi:hypothetical protein